MKRLFLCTEHGVKRVLENTIDLLYKESPRGSKQMLMKCLRLVGILINHATCTTQRSINWKLHKTLNCNLRNGSACLVQDCALQWNQSKAWGLKLCLITQQERNHCLNGIRAVAIA